MPCEWEIYIQQIIDWTNLIVKIIWFVHHIRSRIENNKLITHHTNASRNKSEKLPKWSNPSSKTTTAKLYTKRKIALLIFVHLKDYLNQNKAHYVWHIIYCPHASIALYKQICPFFRSNPCLRSITYKFLAILLWTNERRRCGRQQNKKLATHTNSV